MRTNKRQSSTPLVAVRPHAAAPDRRQRERLRDLCDEVLASFRLAAGRDPISAEDRETARELMRGLGPAGLANR